MAELPGILFCRCLYSDVIPKTVRDSIYTALKDSAVPFDTVDDMCGLAAKKDKSLKRWADRDNLTIIACFPRAVRWLFHAAGFSLGENTCVLNMKLQKPGKIISAVSGIKKTSAHAVEVFVPDRADWVPWFPVLDFDRCKQCAQCANFCLFGVYGISPEGKTEVANPAGCKTGCPACARVCPEAAIIFPKYPQGPIAGDDVTEESLHSGRMRLNLSGLDMEHVRNIIRSKSGGNQEKKDAL